MHPENHDLSATTEPGYKTLATPPSTGERGPVARRRFQKGCFVTEAGGFYSMFYVDDAQGKTKRVKKFIGNLDQMSERAARRAHDQILQNVNQKRGSLAPVFKGQTFQDAVNNWRKAIAPNLSPATVRQRESHFKAHILPRFGRFATQEIDVHELQQFATDLRQSVSRKSVINILTTVFSTLEYAERCKIKVSGVKFSDIELGTRTEQTVVPFFTREQATRIVEEAQEPFKTLFALAWNTGLRAGELLALTVDDLDFTHKTIRVNKATDDSTRIVRQPKTKCSVAALPMPSGLEAVLRNYLMAQWKPNAAGILFPNKKGTRPRSRDNVVKVGLKPVLRKLGIPDKDAGLHAFRHGLATELVEASVPLSVLQKQLRHADVATTLRVYTHAIPQSQRDAMEGVTLQSVRQTGTVLKFASK
jgi:integrase